MIEWETKQEKTVAQDAESVDMISKIEEAEQIENRTENPDEQIVQDEKNQALTEQQQQQQPHMTSGQHDDTEFVKLRDPDVAASFFSQLAEGISQIGTLKHVEQPPK